MTEFTAIETRTNSHRLLGSGTVCNPEKLPKGEFFVEGEEYQVLGYNAETGEFDKPLYLADGSPQIGRRRVACNKCNKVNAQGR